MEIQKISIRIIIFDIHRKKNEGKLVNGTPEEQYIYYTQTLLRDSANINALFSEFPELSRLIDLKVNSIHLSKAEILKHLEQDKDSIIDLFCGGRPFSCAVSLKFTGDPHRGGKQAARLELDNGAVLYYKPHSLKQNIRYQQIYQYLCHQCGIACKNVQYLSYADHGWEENIENKSCSTKKEVQNYYFRMGIHLFIGYALSATDLHGENIIAHGEHPVIIDMETYPGYSINTKEGSAEEKIETILSDSVIHTGMLPVLTWGEGSSTVILSAMSSGESITTPFQVPVVKNRNTSNICIEYEPAKFQIKECIVRLNEKKIRPGEYVGELIDGFQAAYQATLTDQKVKEMMSGFFDDRARVVLRQTQQYHMYEVLSFHPDFMTDRKKRKALFSTMHKKGERTLQKQIRDYEADSLLELDIPYFELEGDSKNLYSADGRCFKNYFPEEPRKAWETHMKKLCKKDLERQCDLIRLSMAMVGQPVRKDFPVYPPQKVSWDASLLKNQIDVIVSRICQSAVIAGTDINWISMKFYDHSRWSFSSAGMYLYGGISGIAVLLAKYLSIFQNEAAANVFHLTVQKLKRHTKAFSQSSEAPVKTGLLEGEGSIVFSYFLLYQITKDREFLDLAKEHFLCMKKYIRQDTGSDVFSGISGAIITALFLYRETGNDLFLKEAVLTEKLLWERRVRQDHGIGWIVEGANVPFAGMAHGNSGILVAYAFLYETTKNPQYLRKIHPILQYEDSLYNDNMGNWLDLRHGKDTLQTMNAWCHGAPGILLARLKLEKHLKASIICKDIERCVRALFSNPGTDSLCLCHGLSGNIWIMRQYLKIHKNAALSFIYEKHCIFLLQILAQQDIWNPTETLNPALMNGISGAACVLIELYQEHFKGDCL